ncbi:MAG: STAS domain-containing protein [Thermotogae bacterium]|nr:STAS domain-containing protein [Thermotogota bacterium]
MRNIGEVLKFRREGDVGIVRFIGEVDTAMREPIIVFFDDKIADGVTTFVIDLSETDYISSAIWGALITILKHVRDKGGDILMCSPKGQVLKIYNVMAFDKVFKTFPSVYDALNYLRRNA